MELAAGDLSLDLASNFYLNNGDDINSFVQLLMRTDGAAARFIGRRPVDLPG